jgi:hypothetical protein
MSDSEAPTTLLGEPRQFRIGSRVGDPEVVDLLK